MTFSNLFLNLNSKSFGRIFLLFRLIPKVWDNLIAKHFDAPEVTFSPEPDDKVVRASPYKAFEHLDDIVGLTYAYRGPSDAVWDLHGCSLHLFHKLWLVHRIFGKIPAEVKL